MKRKLTPYGKRLVKLIVNGVLATATLLFCVLAGGYFLEGNPIAKYLLAVACFFMTCVHITIYLFHGRKKTDLVKCFGLGSVYFALTIISFFLDSKSTMYLLFADVFFASFIYDAVVRIIFKHRIRSIVFSIIEMLFGSVCMLLFFAAFLDPEGGVELGTFLFILIPFIMALIAFAHALIMVFSGVRKTTILQILRKTYSIEILYGLIVLIIATALVLTIIEDNMSIGDALWYCFAIVTTIGFGDITATSIVGRLLSVVLGIYGIIVVALITSIIVNFYNETKHDSEDDKQLKEELKELNEGREIEDKEDSEE